MSRRQSRVPVARLSPGRAPEKAFDDVAVEEPLDLRIDGRTLVVTMRTPGDDFELAAGLCFTEGVLEAGATIAEIRYCPDVETFNTVDIVLRGSPVLHPRSTFASSACGVCGKTAIEDVRRRLPPLSAGPTFPLPTLVEAPDRLRQAQSVFERTGGLHAAGLLTPEGEWLCVREDIGRHNAVDKVIGWAVLGKRMPLSAVALVVSGRAGFEIVQKAWAAQVPVMVAVGAPSSLAVELARDAGMTLAGFARQGRVNLYSGPERIV